MAALTEEQVNFAFGDGTCGKAILLSLKNVTAGDTVDLAKWLSVIKRCGMVSSTGNQIASCSFAGTVVTVPAGPSADGVWVLAVGVSA
jgi:hypothetical protein